MVRLMSEIALVMVDWKLGRIGNFLAYDRIQELILSYQRREWNEAHQ